MKNEFTRTETELSQGLEWARREFVRRHRIDLLAPKVGTTHKTLLDRLNPDNDNHKLSAEVISMLTALTGDNILIEGLANDAGLKLYKAPTSEVSDENIIKLHLRRCSLGAQFGNLLEAALDDGRIDAQEASDLLKCTDDAIGQLTKLKANLKVKSEAA